MTAPAPGPTAEYRLEKPLIQAGNLLEAGAKVILRPEQAEYLAAQGVIAPAKPGRTKTED